LNGKKTQSWNFGNDSINLFLNLQVFWTLDKLVFQCFEGLAFHQMVAKDFLSSLQLLLDEMEESEPELWTSSIKLVLNLQVNERSYRHLHKLSKCLWFCL
jgi:hypothetical protein